MGENTKILTEREMTVLNASLEKIASNLSIHVNESLSIAHGINAKVANYYDSSGDKWGSVVLMFEFGDPPDVIRFYVPAQITTLAAASTSDGVESSAVSSGSFNSSGIPLTLRPLVTELTEDSSNQAEVYNNMLLAHTSTVMSDTGASQCHGGQTYTVGNVLDSLGHVVGNRYITLGINGTSWKIPCATAEAGPGQTMRGINLLASISKRHNVARQGRDDNQYGALWLTDPTGGTGSHTVEWQINALADGSSSTWTVMSDVTVGYHVAATEKVISYDISEGTPPGSYSIKLQASESDDDNTLQCTIRAKITNSAGSVYTNYCRFYANDEDGCSFFGVITFSGPDTNTDTWYEDIPGSPAIQP